MILEIKATGMCGSELLSLPHRPRYLLAWDHALSRAVLAVSARAMVGFQRRRACCCATRW